MIKRLRFAWLDLRAQVRLFWAEVHHDGAVRALHDAHKEAHRAMEFEQVTRVNLSRAQQAASDAVRDVRRHQQRRAVGLR